MEKSSIVLTLTNIIVGFPLLPFIISIKENTYQVRARYHACYVAILVTNRQSFNMVFSHHAYNGISYGQIYLRSRPKLASVGKPAGHDAAQ